MVGGAPAKKAVSPAKKAGTLGRKATAPKKAAAPKATASGKPAAAKAMTAKKVAAPKAGGAAKKPVASKAAAAKKPVAAKTATAKKPAAARAATAKKPAALKKPAAAKATAARKPSRKNSDAALAPEAMPRVRRAADRPMASAAPAPRPPRDRSRGGDEGLRELDWQGVAATARDLARQVARFYAPEVVVGVAKGGVFAGQEVAGTLGCPFYPVRIHRRSRDQGARAPEASRQMPAEIEGRRVLIVDDIAGSGATLDAAVEAASEGGALEARTATLVVREGGFRPDFFGLETGDLVVFPWDYEPTTGAVGGGVDPGDFGV